MDHGGYRRHTKGDIKEAFNESKVGLKTFADITCIFVRMSVANWMSGSQPEVLSSTARRSCLSSDQLLPPPPSSESENMR